MTSIILWLGCHYFHFSTFDIKCIWYSSFDGTKKFFLGKPTDLLQKHVTLPKTVWTFSGNQVKLYCSTIMIPGSKNLLTTNMPHGVLYTAVVWEPGGCYILNPFSSVIRKKFVGLYCDYGLYRDLCICKNLSEPETKRKSKAKEKWKTKNKNSHPP